MERIRQKIGRLCEYIAIVEQIRDECEKRFDSDPVYRGALLHYLYLIADTSIVLAEMVIKHRNLRVPQTYSEAFDILGDNGVLDRDFAYSFAKIAGFRNFLAHDYEQTEAHIICKNILEKLEDVKAYIHQIRKTCGLNH